MYDFGIQPLDPVADEQGSEEILEADDVDALEDEEEDLDIEDE